jgi:hypothetical protein
MSKQSSKEQLYLSAIDSPETAPGQHEDNSTLCLLEQLVGWHFTQVAQAWL